MNEEALNTKNTRAEYAAKRSTGIVLLVEDNIDDVELTLRAFRRKGFTNRVVTLRDGVQALDYLKRRGQYEDVQDPQPSLILLDLKLPRVDGLEVLEQIKTDPQLKMLPVVMLTSSAHERDLAAAYRLGVNSYVCKPADFTELLTVVSTLGDYWFSTVQLPPASPGYRQQPIN